MYSILFIAFCTVSLFAQSNVQVDSLMKKTPDSLSAAIKNVPDSIKASDSTLHKSSDSTAKLNLPVPAKSDSLVSADSLSKNKFKDSVSVKSADSDTTTDTTFLDGRYIGLGIGWSLGSFEPAKMWESTLPSDLSDFHLTANSQIIASDSTSADSLIRAGDSSEVEFTIKDKPSTYNMAFPISLSFTKFSPETRHSLQVSFYVFSKKQKSTISLSNDSLSRRIDIKQKFILLCASVHYMIGKRIPPVYISVDGVDRTDIIAGIGASPLLYMKVSNSVKTFSDDVRIAGIADTIKSLLHSSECYGLSLSFKCGVSTVKHLKKGALDASILYTLTWNDYFYNNGTRFKNGAINPESKEAAENLSFLSNRLEISFAILRKVKNK